MSFLRSSLNDLPASGIALLLYLAEDKEIVSLGVGEPNFDTPQHIIEAASESLRKGRTHYSADPGLLELRKAIAVKTKNDNGIQLNPESEIIVTAGTSPAVFGAIMSLVNRGEEVIIPTPAYLAYDPIVRIAEANPIFVPSYEENDFVASPEGIKEAISRKTKMIVICSPNNPTGSVWERDNLKAVADLASDHNLLVLSDELYERIVFDETKAHSIASLDDMQERTLIINGLSKSHAMTGFRLGWIAGHEDLLSGFKKIHQYSSICAPVTSQEAAVAALTGPDEPVRDMVAEYQRRRNLLVKRINNEVPLLSVRSPKGSFFMFANAKELISKRKVEMKKYLQTAEATKLLSKIPKSLYEPSDLETSDSLLCMLYLYAKARVLTTSGAFFGEAGEGFLRISFAQEYDLIGEAIDRLIRTLSA